jgi:hypothetical protein
MIQAQGQQSWLGKSSEHSSNGYNGFDKLKNSTNSDKIRKMLNSNAFTMSISVGDS